MIRPPQLREPTHRGELLNDETLEMNPSTWKPLVAEYQRPSAKRALWQIANTFVPYALLWVAMYGALQVSLWLTLPLAILAAGFLVRIFIILHDCAHGSYFASRRANRVLGFIAGVLTFFPFEHWRWEHATHHRTAGDLDRRGTGDIWTMTVQEYLAASRKRRLQYRLVRHPVILFLIAPLFVFVVRQRFSSAKAEAPQRHSVWLMNGALLCMAVLLSQVFGWAMYLLIQSIIVTIAGSVGLWLFYVQHQFEGVYWERGERWNYTAAALHGSSYYKLPRVLQWLTGNIGFHHIHHLSPRIPNYNLQKCHESDGLFQQVKPITLRASFRCLRFRFWDEESKRLVGTAFMRELMRRSHVA